MRLSNKQEPESRKSEYNADGNMVDTSANRGRDRKPLLSGLVLLAGGLALNYMFERNSILRIWQNSAYAVSALDGLYPLLCFFLSLTGVVLAIGGAMSRTTIRQLRPYVLTIVIPLTVLYALFSFGIQFVATGADRLGECPGLDQAAASSNVIPESKVTPGRPAVGCGVERRGIFLSYYNDVAVFGVTDAAGQQRVLDEVAGQFRQAHTHPVQVMFFEKENWSVRKLENGRTLGSRGPQKLIRVVNIG
jgi:hypothetical protein